MDARVDEVRIWIDQRLDALAAQIRSGTTGYRVTTSRSDGWRQDHVVVGKVVVAHNPASQRFDDALFTLELQQVPPGREGNVSEPSLVLRATFERGDGLSFGDLDPVVIPIATETESPEARWRSELVDLERAMARPLAEALRSLAHPFDFDDE